MFRHLTPLIVFALLTGCGGGPVNQLADEPDQLTVYSLDGMEWAKKDGQLSPEQAKGELLHGIPVLGTVEVTDAKQRREIVAAVKEAVRNNTHSPAACFYPRHAVRTVKDGRVVTVVDCFQCFNYETYGEDDKHIGRGTTSRSAQPLLTQVLTDAGVRVAPGG